MASDRLNVLINHLLDRMLGYKGLLLSGKSEKLTSRVGNIDIYGNKEVLLK